MRYIRQFTRKQERNQTKTLEQQKHDLDLARKVLTAVTAFSFIGNPFAAMAASTVTRVPGASGEIKFDKNVANIYAEQMKGDTAVNRFQDFKIDAGDIANMYFQSTALQGTDTWAKNLVNFVNSRIDVAGTVNAIKENKIGGNLFFLSSNGMAVTNSGVINAGSLTVLTPTQDIMDLQNKLDGNWSASDFAQITDASQRMEIPLNQDGTITVAGTIHTLGDVQLYAGKHVNVSGMIQTKTGVSELPDTIFKNTVNIGDNNMASWDDLTATEVGNGDIVLSAKSSVTDEREGSAEASIDVSGKLYGNDVNISAESEASFADDGGNITVGEIDTSTVLDKLNFGTLNADYADVSSKASVTIAKDAVIDAKNDVTIEAKSNVAVEVGAAPTQNEDGSYGGFVPAAGVVVADVDNAAAVTVNGTVDAGNNVNVSAEAATELTANAADAGEEEDNGGQKAGGQEPASLIHAAVAVVSNDTNANVSINGGKITGQGDVNVHANVNNSLDVTAQVGAPGASAMATAVAVVNANGAATVDIDNAEISGKNVTIAADNTVDGNVVKVDNGIGVPEEDPAAEEQPEEGGSSPTDEVKGAPTQILCGESLTRVIMNGITSKIEEATGSEEDAAGGKQNAFVKKLGTMLDLGASVAVVEESNSAKVSVDNTKITATGADSGAVDIHANTIVDSTSMIVTGHANKQTNSAKKKGTNGGAAANSASVIADAAVLYNKIDNDAAVQINGATISGNEVAIHSSAQMQYNIRKMYNDLKDSVDALKAALEDTWDDTNAFFKQLDELVAKTGEAVNAVEAEGNDDAVVEQLFNKTITALQEIAENADAVTDSAQTIIGDGQAAKDAFSSVKENLETFKDTDNYINYYVHTQSTDGIEGKASGTKPGNLELGLAGSVNVTNVNNAAATGIGAGTTIQTHKAAITSKAQTETVSITGNAVELMGSKNKKKNPTTGTPTSGSGSSSSTNVGVGASVAVQDITGTSVIMVGEGVQIGGLGENASAEDIIIDSNTIMGQQGIVYGSGVSGGKSGGGTGGSSSTSAELQGMVNLMNGGSDSVVSIDDSVILAGQNVSLTSENSSLITAVTGGVTLGNDTTAASVGASLGMVNYDVNNVVVIGDNGSDADLTQGGGDSAEEKAEDKRKESTRLAKDLIKDAGITLAENTDGKAEAQGTITASNLNVTAETKGLITNIAVEAAANTKSKKKKQNSALSNLTNATSNNTGADALIGENGRVNQRLDQGDTAANGAVDTGNNTSGGALGGDTGTGTTTQAAALAAPGGGNNNSTKSSVNVAGAGSVAINLLDGETGAFVDNVNIQVQQDTSGKDGTVTVGASDSLFDGALAGAAAVNWFTKGGGLSGGGTPSTGGTPVTQAASGSSGGNTEVSVGGAAGVSVLNRNVSSVISNSEITNAGSITNTAEKSGAEIAAGLGLAVAKSSDTSATNVAVGAAVSYNEADSDIHALMVDTTVTHDENVSGTTNITNAAENKDLQIAGGISVGLSSGGKTGVGIGGTAVISDIDSNLQSGISGGTYEDIGDMNVTATVATTQISAGVAGAAAVGAGTTSAAFGGAVNYSTIDNTNKAFINNGANITADGAVSVSAGDTNSDTSDFASFVEDHGIDTSGNTGAEWADNGYDDDENGVNFSNDDNTGSTIVNVATAVGISTSSQGGSGAAAVNVSQVNNSMSADITGATITAGTVAGEADTNTNIVSVAAGIGASGGKFGGAGSVSWNELSNHNKVTISDSTITTGQLTETALNKADIVNVAGQLSGSASGVGIGASMAYNDMNNTTGVYLNGSTVTLTEGSDGIVHLNAENKADIMAITAGATVADIVSVNAMVAVNRGSNSTEAVIGDDGKDVTINGVTSLDVSASDETEEMTIAGGITGAGTAAIGAGVAYSDVGGSSGDNDKAQQKTRAEINHASITTAGETVHVGVFVNDASKLTTIAAGGGIAGTAAVQGEAATALINKQVNAAMNDVDINADDADNTAADVDVTANSDSHILTSADVLTISSTASVGAGVAVNRIVQQTNAAVNGGVMNVNNLTVQANGTPRIENVGVGIAAAGQGAGVAGSVSVNMIDNDVTAHIGSGANIDADGSVGVVATSDEQISNYSGMLAAAGQGAGVGISVSVNQIKGETSATVGDERTNTTVSAKGNGDGLTTSTDISEEDINNTLISSDTVDMNTTIGRQDETRKGFIVDASSTRDMKSFLINIGAAGQGAGVAPTVNVNMIDGVTTAGISHTSVNKSGSAGDVFVNAGDYTNMSGFVGSGGIAGMGAGVGLGSDTNTVSRDVEAVVDGSDVNAKAFEIDAESMQGVSSFTVGAGVAGIGGGVAGVVTVTDLANTTKAELRNSNVTANTVDVTADHKGIVNAGNVGVGVAGIGAGVGLSVGVLKDNSETYAIVRNDEADDKSIEADGDVSISAQNTTTVKPSISATGAGFAGVAGATSINNLNSKVVTDIANASIISNNGSISGTADNTFNVEAYMGSQAGGAGGVGVGVTVNTIDSTVQMNVSDSELQAAQNVALTADETRNIQQTATNVAAGGAAIGANIAITTVGKEITDSDVLAEIDRANNALVNEDTQENNASALLNGAGDALKTAGIEESSVTPSIGAEYGGGKDSQITVNISNSNVTGSAIKAEAAEHDVIDMTLGSGSAGGVAINAGVGILDVNRNVGVHITGGSMTANAIDVNTDITGEANLEVYQGSAGVVSGNAAVGQVSTSGSSTISIDNARFTSNVMNVLAADHGVTNVNVLGVTVGAVSVGAIVAEAENTGNTEVTVTNSTTQDKDGENDGSVSIKTEKANTVTAHAMGGAGGAAAAQGVAATASDSGQSNITLNNGNKLVAKDIVIAAKASPAVKAVADSAAVSIFGTAGGAGATATASGAVNVTVANGNELNADTVDISADAATQDGKNTAEAAVVGASGSGYYTAAENLAKADVAMEVAVSVGDVAYKTETTKSLIGYEDVEDSETGGRSPVYAEDTKGVTNLTISGNNAAKASADAKGITIGGIFSSGNNQALTSNKSQTKVSLASGSENTLLGSLAVTASGAGDNTAKADGSGGGLVSGDLAAYVKNEMNATTQVDISGTMEVEGNVRIEALQSDTANINADALKATVVGASATKAENSITGTTGVSISGAAITGGGDMDVNAANTVTFGDKENYAVEGSGYGGVNVQGAEFDNNINKTANIAITNNSTITTDGAQKYEAKTTGDLNVGGYIKAAGLGAFTWVDVDNTVTSTDTVSVDESSLLKTKKAGKDIVLAAVDNMDMAVTGVADTQGGAVGGASSDVTSTLNRNNSIAVDGTLYSMNDVNLYAGKDKNGSEGKLDLEADSESYNKTALAVSNPELNDTVNQNNQVVINTGGKVDSVRHINAYADAGKETIRDSSVLYTWYWSDKNESYTSSTIGDKEPDNKHSNNFVQADGVLTAGVQNKQYITIGGTYDPETEETDGSQLVFFDDAVKDAVNAYGNGQNAVGEDGLIIDSSEGVDENGIIKGTMDYGTTLFERYNELGELMQAYAENPSSNAYLGYKAERQRILDQMKTMGLVEEIEDATKPGTTYLAPVEGATVDYIELSDIVASGGNINIQSDNLSGSGTLTAKGAPEVVVNNNTNLYLKVNDITVGETGGEIHYNNTALTGDTAKDKASIEKLNQNGMSADFSAISPDAAAEDGGRIVINGNYGGSTVYANVQVDGKTQTIQMTPRSDIEINGLVDAGNGTVEISSAVNNIVIQGGTASESAGVKGQTVKMSASQGSVSQGFQEGIVSIGGDVQDQYASQYEEGKNYFDTIYEFKHDTVHDEWEKNEEVKSDGNRIAGENIYISAADININGEIQSGYEKYVVEIKDTNEVQNKINDLRQNWLDSGSGVLSDAEVMTGDTYRIVKGEDVRGEDGVYYRTLDVYYNPYTGQLVVPDVDAHGGQVYLTGRISSTGSGSIKVLDGAYDISVNNNTTTDLQLGKLVSNDVSGLISITDTAKNTLTEFTRDQTVVKDLTTLDDGDYKVLSTGGSSNVYNPKEDLRYNWTTGQEVTTKEEYSNTIKAGLWGAVETMDKTALDKFEEEHKPTTTPLETEKDKPNGEYIGSISTSKDNISNDDNFIVIYDNTKLEEDRVGPGDPERWSTGFLGWFKWEKYTWSVTTGTSQQYVASVKADKPIEIGFFGNKNGNSNIDINAAGNINLTNTIGAASSGTGSVIDITSTGGAINQKGGSLVGDNIKLQAVAGINDVSITSMGDTVNLNAVNSGSGNINIDVNAAYGTKGDVVINQLFAGSADAQKGNVSLTADRNITQSGKGVSVSGNRIDLASENGAIGTDEQAIVVNGGQSIVDGTDSLSASVNAQAKDDINLTQAQGDMRIGRVYSDNGDVTITVTNGSLIDALPDGETIDRGSTDALIQKWKDLGLIDGDGKYTESQEQDVAEYAAAVKEEFSNYEELKDYYGQQGEVSQEYKDAYAAYSEAKKQYDDLQAEYAVYQKGEKYYTSPDKEPQRNQYKTEDAYQNALAEFKQGKEAFEAAKEKFAGYDSVGAYMEATSPDAYNAYMKPSVTVTETAQDGTMVQNTLDMKSAFDGYAAYEALAETYGNYTSAEDYLKYNDDAQVHIAELQEAGKEYWNKEQLLYAISDNILNPDISETDKVVKDPNLKGNNITVVVHGGSAGLNSDTTKVIGVSDLTDVANLQALANASASNVMWDAAKEEFTITDKLPLGIQSSGAIHIETDGNAYLAGRTEDNAAIENQLNIDLINANDGKGNITLQGHDGIYNVHEGDDAAIIGNDLVIQGGENGSIGTDERMMNVVLNGTLQAQSKGSIYVKQLGGDLELVSVGAGEDIVLQASGSIVNSGVTLAGGAEGQITSEGQGIISLVAGGGIGSADDGLNVEANGAVVNAQAESDIYLSGSGDGGTLVLGTISGENLNVYNEKGSVALGRTDDEGEDVEVVEGSIATAGDAVITAKDNIELSDGTISVNAGAGELTLTAENGSVTQNASLEGSDTGIYAATVNVSSKGSQLLENANNVVTNFVVHGLEENNSLTGDVHLVSNAGTVNIDFSDDEDNGITVNNGSIDVYHTGANGLNVTGSATTQKTDGSEEAADINFHSNEGAIHVDGTMTAGDSFTAVTDSGAITLKGDVTAHNGDVEATTQSGAIEFGGSVSAAQGSITANTQVGEIRVTGQMTAGQDINLTSGAGAITVLGGAAAGSHFSAATQSGDVTIGEADEAGIVTGDVTAEKGTVNVSTNSGSVTVNGAVWSGTDTTFHAGGTEEAAGDITVNGAVHADSAVTAETTVGSIFFGGTTDAGTGITFTSNVGNISTTGSLTTANGDVSAKTGSGTITLGGDVTANGGSVTAHTGSGDVSVSGKADASQDIDLSSDGGDITVKGSATAGSNFSAATGRGGVTLGGTVTAEAGKVLAQTGSGMIQVEGDVYSDLDTELQAGITEDDTGSIIVKGEIASGKEVHASATNGSIRFEGITTASAGDVTATVSGDGDITFNGAVTAVLEGDARGNIAATVSGTGNITTDRDAVFKADKDIQFTTNVGNITANSAVTAGEDIVFKVLTEGNMTLRDDLKSEQNIDLNVNSGNILFEGTQDGVHEDIYVTSNGGDVTVSINEGGSGVIKDTNSEGPTGDWAHLTSAEGNVTVRHDGIGDVDLYELYAKQDAGVSVANGNLHLVDVSGNLVAVFVKSEGKEMDVENIEAAQQIAISGSNMDLDSIKQREDGDGFLVITPEGTADDQPIDNLVIGDILTNGGVRFDHLWLNTGNIHVSEGALHLDKVYVQDKATFSTDDMTTNVFGSAPVYDDSVSSSYWVNTSINSPKDDLAAWNSDELNDKWMHIFFSPEGSVQISNGNLLHLADHNYAYNQRYSQVDWMNLFTDEDFYNFYDKYYAPDLSYHERYGLTSGSGHSVENAEEDEVIVE